MSRTSSLAPFKPRSLKPIEPEDALMAVNDFLTVGQKGLSQLFVGNVTLVRIK